MIGAITIAEQISKKSKRFTPTSSTAVKNIPLRACQKISLWTCIWLENDLRFRLDQIFYLFGYSIKYVFFKNFSTILRVYGAFYLFQPVFSSFSPVFSCVTVFCAALRAFTRLDTLYWPLSPSCNLGRPLPLFTGSSRTSALSAISMFLVFLVDWHRTLLYRPY